MNYNIFHSAVLLEQMCAFPPPLQTNSLWAVGKLCSSKVRIYFLIKHNHHGNQQFKQSYCESQQFKHKFKHSGQVVLQQG